MREIQIEAIINKASNPVVSWSGGKDSNLLLSLVREVKPDIAIMWLKQNVSREWKIWCERLICEWDLTVFSFSAMDSYYLPSEDGLTLIDEYFFGVPMPVLTDVSKGSECAIRVNTKCSPAISYPWDVTLTGYKDSDRHPILGQHYFPEDGTQVGSTKLFAPLRNLTDEQVIAACKERDIPIPDVDDSLPRCTNCLTGSGKVFCPEQNKEINSFQWDREAALSVFRQRFLPLVA